MVPIEKNLINIKLLNDKEKNGLILIIKRYFSILRII